MYLATSRRIALFGIFVILLTGCVAPTVPYDYAALKKSRPRSILVIPPFNNSVEVNAPYIFLSTISKPLAEKGYYVFPVAVIDQFLKENGLPTPAEMNNIPLDRIGDHIGADAVLYATIVDWGQKYQLLTSTTIVHSTLRLVDVRTGDLLWQATVRGQRSSDDAGAGLFGALINALATQVAGSVSDSTPQLSSFANKMSVYNPANGLLHGPYFNPDATIVWKSVEQRDGSDARTELLPMAGATAEVAAADSSTANGKQDEIVRITGTYRSDISSENNWVFNRPKDRQISITFVQNGDEITGTNQAANLKITGTRSGDEISFYTWPSDISSEEIKGNWRISADGNKLEGNWTHPHGGGKWNLSKIR